MRYQLYSVRRIKNSTAVDQPTTVDQVLAVFATVARLCFLSSIAIWSKAVVSFPSFLFSLRFATFQFKTTSFPPEWPRCSRGMDMTPNTYRFEA